MDMHQDLIKWLRTMGYNGEIPVSLIGMCNNSTKFLWEDVMQNVRPMQEVKTIKRNIIVNRLKTKHINKQDDFAYRIQEIEDYRHKIALEQKLHLIKDMVQEKQYKVDKLSQNCKIKGVSIDYLKKKIKENEERKYVLDLKKKQLQIQNSQAEDTLTKLKNVTPVEREESNSVTEITETLEKCAEKLNEILTENQKSVAQNFQKTTIFQTVTQTGKMRNQSSVATYLSIQEREDFEEITRSCVKKPRDKENIPWNIQRGYERPESKKRLFDVPQVIVEDADKRSFGSLSLSIDSRIESDDVFYDGNNQIDSIASRESAKRESLGILPDSYFRDEDDGSFLICSSSVSPRKESHNISVISNDKFMSFMSTNPQKSSDSSDSVVFNYNINNRDKQRNTVRSEKVQEFYKKELYSDSDVIMELETLLHGNNRELLYEALQKLIHNMKVEFTKVVSMEGSMDDKKNKINEDDITKLRFIHLQTELKIGQQKRILKDLVAQIGTRKLEILRSIRSKEDLMDVQDRLDTIIKQVGLDASLAAMKKEINSSKIVENDDNELQLLQSRIFKVKNEIANNIKLIQITTEDLYKAQKFLTSTRESVLSPIWHIKMFETETEWMDPLLENLWSEEIRVFDSFPLEYQRKCTYTDPKTYYRDLCTDNYPADTKMEPEHLQMLSEILESPFNPPEAILLNILKANMKLQVLKNFRRKSSKRIGDQYSKGYSFEELQKQESYLEFSIDKLKAIMYSSRASKTLSMGDVIKKTMEIWTEMPMKDFVSDKRVVGGQNFQFYQNRLHSFL